MKTASTELNTHLNLEVTTLATCWWVRRRDTTVFTFTDHDRPLGIDIGDGSGTLTYSPESSYNRSAVENDDTLAVDNLDITGVLSSTKISEDDLRKGLFDFAEVRIFVVNHQDLTQGILRIRRGWLGEVTITPNGFFQAELRGLTQSLARRQGERYSAECRADLGDSRCKVPIRPDIALRNTAYAVGDYVRAASELEGVEEPTFLAHLDTSTADASLNAASGTLGTEAAIQDTVAQFGAGAVEFTPTASVDPSQSFVEYPDIPAYALGSGEFTIECEARFKDLTAPTQTFMSQYLNTGNQRGWILRRNAGNLELLLSSDGASNTTISGAFAFAIDTWYHIAATRDDVGDVRLFVNGTQVGSTTAFASAVHDSTTPLRLGKQRSAGFDDHPLNGFIDEPRLLVGKALYTANFTRPAAAHQTPAEVRASIDDNSLLFDDRIYRCTVAGTTDAFVQPTYNTTVGLTTVDGSATFTAEEAFSRAIQVSAVSGSDLRKSFTVTELTPNSGGTVSGRDQFPDDAMNGGVVIWETGNNAGVAMEVRDFVADDGVTITQDIELFLDVPFDIQVGDRARIYRGCFKRLQNDCRDIFNNVANFRGEPYVPGQDFLFTYPDAQA